MDKSKKIFYENVLPAKNGKTTNVQFKDHNDLVIEEKKRNDVNFAKKLNNFLFSCISCFFVFIIVSLYNIYFSYDTEKGWNTKNVHVDRGKILDRNGEIIATNIKTKDFYLDTRKVLDSYDLKRKLREIFPEKNNLFFDKVFNKKHYIRIKQHLTPNEINELRKIGDPAIKFHNSIKRIYLHHNLFSHLTGFKSSNITSKVEKNLNSFLKNGNDINLSVDLRVQSIVHKELSESLKKYDANSAVTIIINVHNGEILSLVSLPDFDPNHPENIKAFTENNLATEARYEMGSTLKIFNAALAFENELNLEKRNFRVDKGYQITSEKLIEDKHIKKELINFEEIFTKSSNVGSIKLIEEIGIKKQKLFLKKLGLKENLNLNGLNIVNNKIPDHWDHLASKFISYGYGLSLSPISLVSVYLTLVNGGFKVDPSIMLNANSHKKQILKKETSIKVNNLLKKIVDNGTGKKAKVIGLEVGGKTGTSRKLENGKYSEKKVITSFIGTFPINNPEYIAFVLFDEPRRNTQEFLENFGGNTAAPTFSRIVRKISPILNKNNYLKDY
ncbi:MAG: penicillin-binding protein 2 [Pseudomonadota bacterium]|nr:penicillin-binding protein 2 [Pseudomonadota bacterium]